jgi:hypothetical protein
MGRNRREEIKGDKYLCYIINIREKNIKLGKKILITI